MGQDGVVTELASWADVSRSLRAAHGLAQGDWAATLDVSRKTVQRWERGLGAPDDRVEQLLAAFCAQRDVFARVGRGRLDVGVGDWPELVDVLARSRRGRAPRSIAAAPVGSALIGRDTDLATVQRLLVGHRLVTITGPGGVGKTSLAKAVLGRSSGEALLVELGRVDNADLVLAEIATRVGSVEVGGTSMRDAIVRAIAPGPLLLVLDNMEHLPQAVPMVGDLLASCPLLTVLATSRTLLRLSVEVEHWLAPLATDAVTPAAVTLFATRARQADPGFVAGDDERALMRDICVRLDGVPLAIELAAARLRVVGLGDVHARIDRSLPLLSGGGRDLPARHQSMRASLAWSHDLLEPAERHTLHRMSWFRGGFTLDAADAMTNAPALAEVVGLVDAGLVTRPREPLCDARDGPRVRDRAVITGRTWRRCRTVCAMGYRCRSRSGGQDARRRSRRRARVVRRRTAQSACRVAMLTRPLRWCWRSSVGRRGRRAVGRSLDAHRGPSLARTRGRLPRGPPRGAGDRAQLASLLRRSAARPARGRPPCQHRARDLDWAGDHTRCRLRPPRARTRRRRAGRLRHSPR